MDTICRGKSLQHVKTGENTPLTVKRILTGSPLPNNRKRKFLGSTNKSIKQVLNDGDTIYGDNKFV